MAHRPAGALLAAFMARKPMMPIYVLNLKRAVERRRVMERTAEHLGVELTFVEAIDGSTLSISHRQLVDREARLGISPYHLTDGELGCWFSHRKALQTVVDRGDPAAIILEDDALLLDGFTDAVAALSARAGSLDLITLHRNYRRNERFIPGPRLTAGIGLGRIDTMQIGNVGYAVSQKAAARLLRFLQRPAHPVDKDMHRCWVNGLDVYALSEPVVAHDDAGHSFIDEAGSRLDRNQRMRYPEADQWRWRLARLRARWTDSLCKRLYFAELRHREIRMASILTVPSLSSRLEA